jgi:hypothetical protein
MKSFEGTVLKTTQLGVLFELPCGRRLALKAGEAVLQQADALLGRRVRFQAHLHESTLSLASPIFVIGSSYGLQAVQAQARAEAAE